MGVKGCGRKLSKTTLNIFNVLIILIGAGVIAVSGWSLGNGGALPGGWGDSGVVSSSLILPQSLLWAALALGILAILVSGLGFCAANGKKKHCCSLTIFTVLVMLIGVAILIIGVWIYLAGSWGKSLTTCGQALQNPAGTLSECEPPVFYSESYTQTISQTYTECQFETNASFCLGDSEQAQICRGIYTQIVNPDAADCASISYESFFISTTDYIAPWSFTAGIVLIALGGVIFFMSIPAICLCCAPSKASREKEEVQEEAAARRAAAAGQAGGQPVQGNTRYV